MIRRIGERENEGERNGGLARERGTGEREGVSK